MRVLLQGLASAAGNKALQARKRCKVIVLCAGLISAGGLLAAHSNLMTATTTVHTTNSNSSSLSAAVAAAAAAAAGLRAFEETLMSRETTAQPTQTEERDEFCTSLSSWGEEVLSAVSGREDAVFFTETDIEAEAVPGVKMCAYESAARQNPKRPVVVLIDVRSKIKDTGNLDLPNLHFARSNFTEVIRSSPVEKYWLSGTANDPQKHVHFGNQRFGGAYLDSDTASRAPVPTDLPDFIMRDRLYEINGAVMQMRRGNPFLRLAIRDMGRGKIDYRKRNDLGPIHLSALRKRYCPKPNRKDPDKRVEFACPDFKVLKINQAHMFLLEEYAGRKGMTLDKLRRGVQSGFVIHYFGSNLKIHLGIKFNPSLPLYELIREQCPASDEAMQRDFVEDKKREEEEEKAKAEKS